MKREISLGETKPGTLLENKNQHTSSLHDGAIFAYSSLEMYHE
jgi:hypothetical protein